MHQRSVLGVTTAPRRPFRPWTDNVSADDVAFASPSLKRPAAAPPSPRTLPPPPPPVPLAVLSVAPARAVVSGGKLRVRASVDPALSSDALTVTVGGVALDHDFDGDGRLGDHRGGDGDGDAERILERAGEGGREQQGRVRREGKGRGVRGKRLRTCAARASSRMRSAIELT